jgi:hypothetical protein
MTTHEQGHAAMYFAEFAMPGHDGSTMKIIQFMDMAAR